MIRVVGSCLSCLALAPFGAPRTDQAADRIAIVGARVLTMTEEVVREDHTVLVRDGVVEALGPSAEVEVPADARRVEGAGLWLLPGLIDSHVHLRNEDDLFLNVASGVTTVINMGGSARILELRERVRTGELVGPRIFAGMYVDGTSPAWHLARDPGEGALRVQEARAAGWDFVKAYNALTTETFDALMDEAHHLGVPVLGHAVRGPGLEHVLRSGYRAVSHAEEYLYGYFGSPPDPERIPDAVALTRESGAAVIATLSTYAIIGEQWGDRGEAFLRRSLARPEADWLHPELRTAWKSSDRYAGRTGSLDAALAFQRVLVEALHEAGVPVLAGTDTPSPDIVGTFPGALIRAEIEELRRSGLSPWEALAAATRVPGEFVRASLDAELLVGVVAVGARADLLLLGADPLGDVENLARIEGVVSGGVYRSGTDLRARLAELAVRYREEDG
jgi:imidazolonepropionase-like amidohydrolase